PRRRASIARQKQLAYARGAHARPVAPARCQHVDDKAIAFSSLAQLFDVALGTTAEVKVGTDDDAPDVARPFHSIYELVGREPRECVVEPEDHDRIGARFAQQSYAVMYVGERGRGGARREYLDWQRVERRRDRGGLLVPRAAPEMSDERAVPEMHAVEDPDRQVNGSLWPAAEVRERFDRPRLVGRTHSGRRRFADGVERDWHRRGGRLRQKHGRRFANRAR